MGCLYIACSLIEKLGKNHYTDHTVFVCSLIKKIYSQLLSEKSKVTSII